LQLVSILALGSKSHKSLKRLGRTAAVPQEAG